MSVGVTDELEAAAAQLGGALQISVEAVDRGARAPTAARWRAIAISDTGSRPIAGFAVATTAERARHLATIECAERWAQFCHRTKPIVRDSAAALGAAAIDPRRLGLYAAEQYMTPGFELAAFDPAAPLEWVACRSLHDGRQVLVPLEFVHPHASFRTRRRLVAESSSGTAAHLSVASAQLAAVCEVIERDAAMMLWHRHAPARLVPLAAAREEESAEALAALRRDGAIALLLSLDRDLGVHVSLAVALSEGRRFAYGLGCHPVPAVAERRAVRELTHRTAERRVPRARLVGVPAARTPADHLALYDGGPLHAAVRSMLSTAREPLGDDEGEEPVDDPLTFVLGAIETRGLCALGCDITPPPYAAAGVSVVRALVPGLVPLYFGHDRIRLGCRRLVGDDAPGRLVSLLPHPFA